MALCKVMIIGNLGSDPEMRYTPTGRAVTQFNVAVNQSTKNQQTGEWVEETDWFRVSVWGDRAERMAETPAQGQQGLRGGSLQDPPVRGPRRPEADLPGDHRGQHRQPRAQPRDEDGSFGGQSAAGLRRRPDRAVATVPAASPPATRPGDLDDLPF